MNRVIFSLATLLIGTSAMAAEPVTPPPAAEAAQRCQEMLAGEALSEADRQLYLNACVTELSAASAPKEKGSI